MSRKHEQQQQQEKSSIEFRSFEDDSWYDVQLALRANDTLAVIYNQFPAEKLHFKPTDFQTFDHLKSFKHRFRPLSLPLQDYQCSQVLNGITVCASHSFSTGDRCFYDAVVEQVLQKEHVFENGEELCKCNFLMCWTHGPNVGNQAAKSVENICLIQSGDLEDHPALASFLQIVMKKIGGNPGHLHSFVDFDLPNDKGIESHIIEKQDINIGSYHHMILIDNLEKDVSPLAITEFIHEHTLIPTLAHVFPSYSSEQYARGAIMLSSGEHLDPLFHFLDNPDHIIVSSRGRPWVVPERKSRHDALLMGQLMSVAQAQLHHPIVISTDIKVIHRGAREYGKAKQLKDIFLEFIDHQKGLHVQLAAEYSVILRL